MLGGSTNIRLQFSQRPAKIGLEWPGFLAPRPEDSSHALSQIYFTWTKKCSASRCGPSNRAEVLPILKKKDVQPTKPFLLLPPDEKPLQMSSIQLALVGQCGCRVSAQCVPDCSRAKDCSTYYLLNMFSSLIRLTLRDYGSVLATVMARMELQTLARDFH